MEVAQGFCNEWTAGLNLVPLDQLTISTATLLGDICPARMEFELDAHVQHGLKQFDTPAGKIMFLDEVRNEASDALWLYSRVLAVLKYNQTSLLPALMKENWTIPQMISRANEIKEAVYICETRLGEAAKRYHGCTYWGGWSLDTLRNMISSSDDRRAQVEQDLDKRIDNTNVDRPVEQQSEFDFEEALENASDPNDRLALIEEAWAKNEDTETVVDALFEELLGDDEATRLLAFKTTGRMGIKSSEVFDELIWSLEEESQEIRDAAANALVAIGTDEMGNTPIIRVLQLWIETMLDVPEDTKILMDEEFAEIVQNLVRLGVDVNAKNNKGESTSHWAQKWVEFSGGRNILNVLLKAGMKYYN